MELKEIINRPSPANFTIPELEFVVQEYIRRVVGVSVEINVHKNVSPDVAYLNPWGQVCLLYTSDAADE